MFGEERHLVLTSGVKALMLIMVSGAVPGRISQARRIDEWIRAGLSATLLTTEI